MKPPPDGIDDDGEYWVIPIKLNGPPRQASTPGPAGGAHSPGPWRVGEPWQVIDAEGEEVADATAGTETDARLIAAAPELLEALRDMVLRIRDFQPVGVRLLMRYGALIHRIEGK